MIKKCRICKLCDQEIKRGENCFRIPKMSSVHVECYKQYLVEQKGEGYAEFKINKLLKKQEETKQIREQKAIENEKTKEKNIVYKKKLLGYFKQTYDVTLPKQFFIKLSNINNGKYKRLKEKISYEDLLDMFKRKQFELDKMAANKQKHGEEFNNKYNRLCYDLEVIINKYDSYKQWKEKQQVFSIREEKMKKVTDSFNNSIVSRQENVVKEKNKSKTKNIGDLLDEVF